MENHECYFNYECSRFYKHFNNTDESEEQKDSKITKDTEEKAEPKNITEKKNFALDNINTVKKYLEVLIKKDESGNSILFYEILIKVYFIFNIISIVFFLFTKILSQFIY